MSTLLRALLVVLLLLASGAPAFAQDRAAKCTCEKRRACYHYLNAPVDAPDDPCLCAKCESGPRHRGAKAVPGWNRACWTSGRMDCFLKRHAASWKLTCSACVERPDCCSYAEGSHCPMCDDPGHEDPFRRDPFRKATGEAVSERMAVERRYFKKTEPVIAYSRHFYVVTDIPKMRLRTESGGFRWATTHEWAHLMVERAEKAFAEFKEELDPRVRLSRPMGIFLPKGENTARNLQEVYFRARRNHMIYSAYGSSSDSAISEGFCLNGFCISQERMKGNAGASKNNGKDDYAIHQAVRHMIGHILITCWVRTDGDNRTLPRWLFVGAGHWLGKRQERLSDNVYYCTGEDHELSGSGKEWAKELRVRAERKGFEPLEELMGVTSLGGLDHHDHQRAWGYFDVMMREWREPWVAMLAALRREMDQREAFDKFLGLSPEQFHERWVERLLGERDTIAPAGGGRVTSDEPPPRPALDTTLDPARLAARIRGLGEVADADSARKLLDILGATDSDLVRETAALVLRKARPGPARNAIVDHGLTHGRRMTRAYAARLCRKMNLTEARFPLRKVLDDPFWLARAEAAMASGRIKDYDAQARIREMLSDGSPKARIGAMDALTHFGEDVNPVGIPPIAENLSHSAWQVRLTACQALAEIGDHQAIEPLIARLKVESGRVREALLETLRTIAGEDFGNSPERWRKWWELEREHVIERGGFTTGVEPKKDPKEPSRYAPEESPHYYGLRIFSQRVAYVLDTSRSTHRNFRPDDDTAKRLLGDYTERTTTVNGICQDEITHSVANLDPRARFNLIAFGSTVRVWKDDMVPATPGNKRAAGSFVRSRSPNGETNFHGALAAALDLNDHPIESSALRDTPDTVHFLTDGTPTVGDIVDPDTLLAWYTDLNRYARARTHTIAFGVLGVDEKLLRRLAGQNWGEFVQLHETDPK